VSYKKMNERRDSVEELCNDKIQVETMNAISVA
jgi:hypothetical protein